MAKPKYCPVLSRPTLADSTGAMVKCKGKNCALFKAEDQSCLLDDIPTVGATSEVMQVVEEMPSNAEWQSAVEAIERVEQRVAGNSKETKASILVLSEELRDGNERVEEVLEELVPVIKDVTQEMLAIREAIRSVDRQRQDLASEKDKARDGVKALLLYREGLEHFHAGRRTEAIRALRECVLHDKNAPADAPAALGAALVVGGELPEGIRLLREAFDNQPSLAAPATNLAFACLKIGKYEDAVEAAEEAIRRDPQSGAARNTLGNALFKLGRTPEAVDAWLKALATDPSLEAARENLRRQRVLPTEELMDRLTS
jgi:tetratricopeptide (TPR) repeat protein